MCVRVCVCVCVCVCVVRPSMRRGPSNHPGVGLCEYVGDWSGQSAPEMFSCSVDREWWQQHGTRWDCSFWPVCVVLLQRSCGPQRILLTCGQLFAIRLCSELSVPMQCV